MKKILFLLFSTLLMIHAGMPIYRERKGKKRVRANNNNNSSDSEGDAAFEKLVEEMMGRVFLTSLILASQAPNSEELERLTTEATETMDRISSVDSSSNRRPRTRRSFSEIIRSEFDNNARPSRRRRTMAEMIETPIPDYDNNSHDEKDSDDGNDSNDNEHDYDDWPKDRNGDISDGHIPGHSGFFAFR